ncbi:MAG TPA: putative oxidoreductase C-terminal domain-containing protein [Burkholderiales bacterium]|nr:putative oxidoreductase C-terminal domain-containing protein [Burkholderiales bacterium]
MASLAGAGESGAPRSARHTLIVLDPGHFHAALTLRQRHPRLNDDVYVYAGDGPDVEGFLRIVESFNARERNPTRWKLHVYRGADPISRLVAERRGNLVIVAGRNDTKMTSIHRLHAEGFHVLGDKPWLIDIEGIELLRRTIAGAPLAMDIMTERHQLATQVKKALIDRPEVFGDFRLSGEAAISFESVHHLYKMVNDRPLVRPYWFFDTSVQGEGIVDVTTHLVDLAQWFVEDGRAFDYARDVELLHARQWPTTVPLEIFSRITGLNAFPPELEYDVEGDTLNYLCNASFAFRLRDVPVAIESRWDLQIPEGGGDTHHAVVHGTRAALTIDQGPATAYRTQLSVHPAATGLRVSERALVEAIGALQERFPGLGYRRDGEVYRLELPEALRSGHEAHFSAVLDQFIDHIDSGRWPTNLGPDLVTKYTLLANARELSMRI